MNDNHGFINSRSPHDAKEIGKNRDLAREVLNSTFVTGLSSLLHIIIAAANYIVDGVKSATFSVNSSNQPILKHDIGGKKVQSMHIFFGGNNVPIPIDSQIVALLLSANSIAINEGYSGVFEFMLGNDDWIRSFDNEYSDLINLPSYENNIRNLFSMLYIPSNYLLHLRGNPSIDGYFRGVNKWHHALFYEALKYTSMRFLFPFKKELKNYLSNRTVRAKPNIPSYTYGEITGALKSSVVPHDDFLHYCNVIDQGLGGSSLAGARGGSSPRGAYRGRGGNSRIG